MIQRRMPFLGRRLAAAALSLALTAALGGCVSLWPKAQPANLYSFGLADVPETPLNIAARGVTLEPVDFPREAMGDGILTVQGSETAYIAGARWVAPATVMFRQALDRAFDAAAPGAHLLGRGEAGPSVALLGIDVTRFEAVYTDPKSPPTVRVTLRARLGGPDGTPIDAAVFDISKTASENRVAAIVAAYHAATEEALTGLARWVDQKTPDVSPIRLVPRSTSRPSSTMSTTTTSTTTTRQP